MKSILKTLILLFLYSNISGQSIQIISQGIGSDSSYYCIEKINDNEFWAGGEYGILKSIDSLGTINSISFPKTGIDILKIKRIQNYIYITTSNAVIYRYDILAKTFIKKEFHDFKNKCFYDLLELENGSLMVCGGASGIANGDKKIPRGFIATLDKDLENIQVVWKCYRKFVWSLLEDKNHDVLGFTFNGKNTHVIKSHDSKKWEKDFKVKGLVHKTLLINNQIWYSGTKKINFKKDGIIGTNILGQKVLNQVGSLWSLEDMNDNVIAVSHSGAIFLFDKNTDEASKIKLPSLFTLYDLKKVSDSKIIVVGHGKTIGIVNL